MKEKYLTILKRFRLVALLEGISAVLLFFVAMPLKYYFGMPEAVKMVGWAHGILFLLYIAVMLQVKFTMRWSFLWMIQAFVASLIPVGTFLLDIQLKKEEAKISAWFKS